MCDAKQVPSSILPPRDSKRPTCRQCMRALRACICQWVTPVQNRGEVLILQHPLEAGHAKGSAQLLRMSLAHCRLAVGERFDEPSLRLLLSAQQAARQPVLLYPQTPGMPGQTDSAVAGDCASAPAVPDDPDRICLVVLDGTWRKSRKMLYLNPLLQSLPRLALRDAPPSHYRIRKAHGAQQLSTLEAACYALMQLEGDAEKYRPLLRAFDGFVAQQAQFFGVSDRSGE